MRCLLGLSALLALLASADAADAAVAVAIDLTHQTMHVDGARGSYDWPISSARSGFYTPGGSFAPTHLELMHYSKKYHMSPMPHAIFFRGGYAIHGTYSTAELGRPASHGCVRLSPGHAAELYSMVQEEGARISISGHPPASRPFGTEVAGRHASRRSYAENPYEPAPARRGYYYTYGTTYAPGYGDMQPGYRYAPAYAYPAEGLPQQSMGFDGE